MKKIIGAKNTLIIIIGLGVIFSLPLRACDNHYLSKALINLKTMKGLSEGGLEKIKDQSQKILQRIKLFNKEILELPMIHHALMVSRIMNGNIFLYGPTGGAKTMLSDWFMSGEKEKTFQLQMHEMIGESDLVGGTILEEAEKGLSRKNIKGRLLDVTVALIDEAEKGSPMAYASLFNILSARKALLGDKVIKSKLKTLILTSNANLSEFKETFILNGQPTTPDALLNRLHFKGFVYNWLSRENMVTLLKRQKEKNRLKALAQNNPNQRIDDLFEKPEQLDWESLENLAENIFDFSDDFEVHLVHFLEEMRSKNNEARILSEAKVEENQGRYSDIYHPSGDLSIRLVLEIQKIIKASALVDFLSSPLVKDPKILDFLRESRFKLDYLSIWRSYLNQTTIGPGKTELKFLESDLGIGLDFSWKIDISQARNIREKNLIKNVKEEQLRFDMSFRNLLSQVKNALKISGEFSNGKSSSIESLGEKSFEILLLKSKKGN